MGGKAESTAVECFEQYVRLEYHFSTKIAYHSPKSKKLILDKHKSILKEN